MTSTDRIDEKGTVTPDNNQGWTAQMNLVIYEHPLNEKLRTFMRVEHLFVQINGCKSFQHESQYSSFFGSLFALIDLLERNDIRAELGKDLERNEQSLVKWGLQECFWKHGQLTRRFGQRFR